MALIDTGRAIGAVTRLIQSRLVEALSVVPTDAIPIARVSIGRRSRQPPPGRNVAYSLYGAEVDGPEPAARRGRTAAWLSLHYLLTARQDGESDTIEAHEIGGELRRPQAMNFRPMALATSVDLLVTTRS
jgi:hypothetical protein